MEYQQHYNNVQQPHQQMAPGQSQIGGLSLPDAGTASEKAMMWGGVQQYMPESGYSTQAPSISGSIDPFAQNDMDTNSTAGGASTVQNDWNYNKTVQPAASFAQQQPAQQVSFVLTNLLFRLNFSNLFLDTLYIPNGLCIDHNFDQKCVKSINC